MGNLRKSILVPLDAALRSLRSQSIVFKLSLFVGLLVALTAAILITVVYYYTGEMLRDQVDNRLSAVADDRRSLLVSGLNQVEERIRIVAGRYRLLEMIEQRSRERNGAEQMPSESIRILDDVRAGAEGLMALWIEDRAGRRVASCGPQNLIELCSRIDRSHSVSSRDPALVGFPQAANSTYVALFQTPARSRKQEVLGSLFLIMDVGPVVTALADLRRLGETGEVVVGAREQDIVHCLFPPRLSPGQIEIPLKGSPALQRALSGEAGFTRALDRLGRPVLAAYRPVGYENWGLVVKMDVDEAYAPVIRLRRLLLALGSLILTAGLAASYLIARQYTRPIRRLAATAHSIARGNLSARINVAPGDEIGTLGLAFNHMTEQLIGSQSDLERRIAERTRDLEATRDLLDAFFRIFTSRLDPQNIDRTFDSVLRFCHQLGYDLAMIALVDQEAGVIRGVRGAGTMSDVVGLTVRPLSGEDILTVVVREGRTIVISDSTTDPRCDQNAVALARIHGQIIVPLIGDNSPVLGTLQVATPEILDAAQIDLRPLVSLASHTARALDGLKQVEEIRRLNRSLAAQAAELLKSEAALREQTRILRSVLDCMGEGVVVADRDARLLLMNPAAARILGQTSGAVVPEPWNAQHRVYWPDRTTPYATEDLPLYRAIRGETVDHVEAFIAYPSLQNGSWTLINARPLRDENDETQGGLVVFHDITRRKNSERRLAVQYAATRVLAEVDSLNEAGPQILEIIGQRLDWDFGAFWRVDHGVHQMRCVSLWHGTGASFARFEAATRKTTYGPGFGLPGRVWSARHAFWISEISQEANFPRWQAAVEEGLHSGCAAPILVRGDCLGIFEFFSREPRSPDADLLEMLTNLGTQIGQFIERHQMHTRVVQSEKLASLGMLSAGVAHEINNPLAYIANNLAVLERDIGSLLSLISTYETVHDLLASHRPEIISAIEQLNEECDFAYIKENLDKILASTRQGVKRVAEIVHNLRGFARLDRAAVDQIDVHEPIETALEMIRGRLQRRRITVEQSRGELPLISASPVQLNQVFLNLLVNAMQAIESTHQENGRIEIRSRDEGREVIVEITDNGCGIPADILPQIFNPFFTTKDVGDGTGLGLSITHGIIQDHGGRMEVDSTPGRGTCFRVVLPIAKFKEKTA